ncbi:unnamed protein product [Cuscuta campestris]|uniref:Protein kinase domain-containing protein n=1 Tax=Cuscuta campestris TaxID=132261 RepID=A0A484KBV7_9ASTE|nr:unnamed protein product [Cuscuta campestris]
MEVQGLGILGLLIFLVFLSFPNNGEAQTKSFFINCGTNSSLNVGGKQWVGDTTSGNNMSLSSHGIEASSAASINGNLVDYAPLYRTARFFSESLNYTFLRPPGKFFLRLHFYPFAFRNYNMNESYFKVVANGLRLLSKFSVTGEILQKNSHVSTSNSSFMALVKEYFVPVESNVFVIDFIPDKGSFGFVNAIEIVAVVDGLFVDVVNKVGRNGGKSYLNLSKQGIETMYRLNMGGSMIKPLQDSVFGRTWEEDSGYMINSNAGSEARNKSSITYASPNDTSIAPLLVYETARTMTDTSVLEKRFNMSWKLEVDPDFEYLIRLHFCELEYDKPRQRIFKIYINNQTAAEKVDIFTRAGGKNAAYHEDYFDVMPSKSKSLWVQVGPDSSMGSQDADAMLNGLEVFKLSHNDNLAPIQNFGDAQGKRRSKTAIIWMGIGAGIVFIMVFAGIALLLTCLCKKKRGNGKKSTSPSRWRPLFLHGSIVSNNGKAKGLTCGSLGTIRSGRRFLLTDIKEATNNFDESLVIGVGGFGKVYKGYIDDGTLAAVKRSNPQSQQGLAEFETEIELLSKLRHKHLVSLIGFCDEQDEMILVYEYMSNGTLRSHLFGSDLPPLSWKQRLEICIGAARGLHYLHTGSERGIIHRDVKTTNILLDEDFVAKMADFGLSKTGPTLDHTHVSTAVKGSFGYLDPEYFRRQQLTEKSDVYSFGVVLFEVVCARAVINPSLPKDQINLAEWARRWQRQRSLETIIDPQLKGKYSPESLATFGEIAEKCLADEGKTRPTMGEVLWHLEHVLQLQKYWLQSNDGEKLVDDASAPNAFEEKEEPERVSRTIL